MSLELKENGTLFDPSAEDLINCSVEEIRLKKKEEINNIQMGNR